jgi:hypothetical protein
MIRATRTSLASTALVALAFAHACKVERVRDMPAAEEHVAHEGAFAVVPASEPVDEEKSLVEAELRRQLSLLTSPYLTGRRPGTEGAALTANHLERTMLEIGLDPAGVGGGWRQPVVVRIREVEDARLELPSGTVGEEPETLRHGEGIVLWRAEGGGAWTMEAPVVDAGWGITAPDLAYDDYSTVDAKGKIVLVRDGVPPDRGFDPEAAADYGSRAYKLERARRVGAAGCLIAIGALRSESAWQSAVEELRAPRIDAGASTEGEAKAHVQLAGVLSAEAEAELRTWLAAMSPDAPPRSVRVAGSTLERTVLDPNVIGRIPGAERPEEVVIVLAHWDAGGAGPVLPEGGAAIDNASGVAALLAMARKSTDWVRRGRRPARSIAFVVTASDTLDLAGSRAFLEAGPLRRSQVVAVIALDALGVRSGGPSLGALGLEASELAVDLRRARPGIRAVEPGQGVHAVLPHELALAANVAAVTLTRHEATTGADERAVDPADNPVDLADDVRLVFDIAWGLAESARTPALAPADPPVVDDG